MAVDRSQLELLRAYHEEGDERARDQLIAETAARARDRPPLLAARRALDDLVQVGSIGLIKAIDRFDLERGVASDLRRADIVGEIKRHFRDRAWASMFRAGSRS